MDDVNQMILLSELFAEADSQASKDAKAKGLDYMSFGRWGKNGKMTHKSEKGKLVPISKAQATRSTGMTFGRGKNANTMYGTKGRTAFDPTAKYDPKSGRMSSLTKRTPDQERERQQEPHPDDVLGQRQSDSKRRGFNKYNAIAHPYQEEVYQAIQNGDLEINGKYPSSQFMQVTGLNPQQFKFLALYNQKYAEYDGTFWYDKDTDNVHINDPWEA